MSRALAVGPMLAVLVAAAASRSAAATAPTNLAPPTLPAQLSLDEALRIFRAHGLDLVIAEATVAGAEGDVRAAGFIPNPNFSVGLYRSFFSPGLFESQYGWFIGVGDSNAIEDTLSGKRHLRIRVAEAALRAARMSRVDAQRTLEFQVKQAYIQAVLARDQLDFALEIQKSNTQTFELTRLRFKAGAINEADEAKVETTKLESDQAVRTAEQNLQVAKVGIAFLLGVRGRVPDFQVEQDLPKYFVPGPLATATPDSLLHDAFANRPDLRALGHQRERAQSSVSLAKRLRFPDLSFNLQYSAQGSSSGSPNSPSPAVDAKGNPVAGIFIPGAATTPISPPTLQFSIGGTLPFLYQQQGEIRKAEADLRTQNATYAKVEAQVLADVSTAYENFRSTRELVERMESRLLDRAKRARDLTELQYKKGAASLLEFLDAQRTYIAINVEYLQDLTNYWTAIFQLEQAVGTALR